MDRYYEIQTELLCYLNDNMVEPTKHVKGIVKLFDIEFVDTEETHGWVLSE